MRHLSMQRVSVQPLQWRRAPAPTVVSRNRRMTCAMAGSPAVYTPTTGSFERMIGGHAQEQAALQRMGRTAYNHVCMVTVHASQQLDMWRLKQQPVSFGLLASIVGALLFAAASLVVRALVVRIPKARVQHQLAPRRAAPCGVATPVSSLDVLRRVRRRAWPVQRTTVEYPRREWARGLITPVVELRGAGGGHTAPGARPAKKAQSHKTTTKSLHETTSLDRWLAALNMSPDPLVVTLAGLGLVAELLANAGADAHSKQMERTLRKMGLELEAELGFGNVGMVMLAVSKPNALSAKEGDEAAPPAWAGQDALAVKMLRVGKTKNPTYVTAFKEEMELCAALPPHPNVVRVFHVQTVSPQYILMELCNQGRLFDALHGRKTRHALDVRSLAIDLAHAVAHLHQHRTVHVDIKSPNVMLAWDSAQSRLVAKLCDFGSAAHLDRLPEQGFAQRIGTALWMPPEMLSSRSRAAAELEAQLAAGDVYSFAMTLWEMLTGTVPWAEELYNKSERRGSAHDPSTPAQIVAHVTERVVNKELRPNVPTWVSPAIASLLLACWAADPAQRPSMEKVIEVLRTTEHWDTDGRLAKQATLASDWAKETGLLRHTVVSKSNVVVGSNRWPIVSSSASFLPIHPSAVARSIATKRPKGGRTASDARRC